MGRPHEKLRQLIANRQIEQLLTACEGALWEPVDQAFCAWLEQCYLSSLGAALLTTLSRLAPNIDPADLHIDLDGWCIWISEAVPGGIGIVSRIAGMLKLRPGEFDLQMQDTLAFRAREQLGAQLQAIANCIARDDLLVGGPL
ncbi:MAG TPA: hypothetical protein VGF67_30085 [Ktedonobacteraceae bacterium]